MKNEEFTMRHSSADNSSFFIQNYSSFKRNSSINLYSFFPKYFKNCVRSKVLMP